MKDISSNTWAAIIGIIFMVFAYFAVTTMFTDEEKELIKEKGILENEDIDHYVETGEIIYRDEYNQIDYIIDTDSPNN